MVNTYASTVKAPKFVALCHSCHRKLRQLLKNPVWFGGCLGFPVMAETSLPPEASPPDWHLVGVRPASLGANMYLTLWALTLFCHPGSSLASTSMTTWGKFFLAYF